MNKNELIRLAMDGPKVVLTDSERRELILSIIQISADRGDQHHPFYRGIELPMTGK